LLVSTPTNNLVEQDEGGVPAGRSDSARRRPANSGRCRAIAFSPPDSGAVQFLGEKAASRAVRPVRILTVEAVPGGVVEDLLELLFPARRRVVGLGLLDPLAEENVQGVRDRLP